MMRTVLRDVLSCDLPKIWSSVALRLQPRLRVAGLIGVFGTAALAASVSPVVAGFDQVETERVSASLFTTDVGVQPGTPTTIGLELEMDEGWHVYWRNPGDSGAPPTIQWTVPEGVEVGNIAWPLPERLPYGPLVNFGYEGTIVLTMPFTVPETAAAQQTIPVVADVTWLVCEEICIPEDAQFAFDVTVSLSGPVEDPIWSDVARTAAQSLPSTSPWNARFSANDNGFTLGISAPELSNGRITAAEFFPNDDGVIENAAPQLFGVGETGLAVRTNNGVDARTLDGPIAGLLVIEEEVGDGNRLRQGFIISAERGSAPVPGADALAATVAGMTLWYAILFALLGGIILNVMPCVFPVLSLKAMSLVKTASEDARAARISGLSYTAGILTCFMVLAGVLLALKASGAAIGWGFQLQSPAVVMLLAFILFLVGLNLSGVFELRLSSGGVGQSLAGRGGA
ncbi:MAG: protein-disulfide reductase DsbD domain-containing protein, partial [Pseudomonadota bacterium]